MSDSMVIMGAGVLFAITARVLEVDAMSIILILVMSSTFAIVTHWYHRVRANPVLATHRGDLWHVIIPGTVTLVPLLSLVFTIPPSSIPIVPPPPSIRPLLFAVFVSTGGVILTCILVWHIVTDRRREKRGEPHDTPGQRLVEMATLRAAACSGLAWVVLNIGKRVQETWPAFHNAAAAALALAWAAFVATGVLALVGIPRAHKDACLLERNTDVIYD